MVCGRLNCLVKVILFICDTYLLNSRRTTQMMMNMTAMATSTPIMVGSTYRVVTMGRFTVPGYRRVEKEKKKRTETWHKISDGN